MMRHRTATLLQAALAQLLVACGGPSETPDGPPPSTAAAEPTTRPAGESASGTAGPATAPTIAAAAPDPHAPAAPTVDSPAATERLDVDTGAAIVFRSVRVRTRQVGGLAVPRPELPDVASSARLDELLAEASAGAIECDMPLALPTLVSLRCLDDAMNTGRGARGGSRIRHFRVGAAGNVAEVPFASLFREGFDPLSFVRRVLRDADAPEHFAVLSERGLELNSSRNVVAPAATVGYRELAALVRAESPLGALLAERGLTLAAGDGSMPAPLPTVGGLYARGGDAAAAVLQAWSYLPAARQAEVRFAAPRGDTAALLAFPPPATRDEISAMRTSLGIYREVYPFSALYHAGDSRIVWRVSAGSIEVHERPESASRLIARLPPGTRVPAVVGHVNVAASDPDGAWAFVGFSVNRTGWVRGAGLSVPDAACFPDDPEDPLHGLVILRGRVGGCAGGPASHVWVLRKTTSSRGFTLDVHPVTGCTLGASVRIPLQNEPRELSFARPGGAEGPLWVAIVDERGQFSVSRGDVAAPPSPGPTPDAAELTACPTDGPEGGTGAYAFRFETRDGRTYLRESGGSLEVVPAPR